MLVIPGPASRDTCDGMTRRDLLRVGGSAVLGFSLADILRLQKASAAEAPRAAATALWQSQERHPRLSPGRPEPSRPVGSEGQRARQRPQRLQADRAPRPGLKFTELLPKLAQVTDKVTMIRSMSYTPVGLFNHTAAIYQMLTGYTADKVSPSGQLEPPTPEGLPELRLATSSGSSRRPCRCCRS